MKTQAAASKNLENALLQCDCIHWNKHVECIPLGEPFEDWLI